MASEPMSDARIVEITQAFADIPQGSKPIVIYDTDAFRALLAEANRLRAREAALVEIALQVAQGQWSRVNGVDVCAFCHVPFHYPAHTVEHRASCATLMARAILGD